jgi:hypothetical protein
MHTLTGFPINIGRMFQQWFFFPKMSALRPRRHVLYTFKITTRVCIILPPSRTVPPAAFRAAPCVGRTMEEGRSNGLRTGSTRSTTFDSSSESNSHSDLAFRFDYGFRFRMGLHCDVFLIADEVEPKPELEHFIRDG